MLGPTRIIEVKLVIYEMLRCPIRLNFNLACARIVVISSDSRRIDLGSTILR